MGGRGGFEGLSRGAQVLRALCALRTLALAASAMALAACTAMAPVNAPIAQPQASQGKLPELDETQHSNPDVALQPRYWMARTVVDARLGVGGGREATDGRAADNQHQSTCVWRH